MLFFQLSLFLPLWFATTSNAYIKPNIRNGLASKLALEGRTYSEGQFLPELLPGYCYPFTGRWQAWLRTVAYDALDYDASTGTGGIDGSVFYEVDRLPPDVQKDVLTTAADFESMASKYMSRADLLAYIVTLVGAQCQPNIYPAFSFGRSDAYAASPPSAVNKTGLSEIELQNLAECANNYMFNYVSMDAWPCYRLWSKVVSTLVPRGTTLSPALDGWDDQGFFIDTAQLVPEKDDLFLNFRIRVGFPVASEVDYTIYWCDRYGDNKDCAQSTRKAAVTNLFSPTSDLKPGCFSVKPTSIGSGFYMDAPWACDFKVPIDPKLGVSKYWFEALTYKTWPQTMDNGGNKFPLEQDEVVFVPSLSQAIYNEGQGLNDLHFVVGIKNNLQPTEASANFYDYGLLTTSPPQRPTQLTTPLERNTTLGSSQAGYDFYSAYFIASKRPTGTVDFVVVAGGEKYVLDFVSAARIPGYLGDLRSSAPLMRVDA